MSAYPPTPDVAEVGHERLKLTRLGHSRWHGLGILSPRPYRTRHGPFSLDVSPSAEFSPPPSRSAPIPPFSLFISSIFETGPTNQFFLKLRAHAYIKTFSAFQVLATKRTGFWVVIISMPLVSQHHLLRFPIAALDLAAARLVAVAVVCQGEALEERQGLVPGAALAVAWVFGLGS